MNISSPAALEEANHLNQVLKKHQELFFPVLGEKFPDERICFIDLSKKNPDLKEIDFEDTNLLHQYIFEFIQEQGALAGAGGYLENRIIYSRSQVFTGNGTESRSIHLGIDLWAPAFTPVFAPLGGKILNVQDNASYGDYGPTIILEHQLEEITFFTLYGHLSRRSIKGLKKGQDVQKGAAFTELGPPPENGDWPPHLHFQLIRDLEGNTGDYPGVAAPSQLKKYQANCPDPNLILNLKLLSFES